MTTIPRVALSGSEQGPAVVSDPSLASRPKFSKCAACFFWISSEATPKLSLRATVVFEAPGREPNGTRFVGFAPQFASIRGRIRK